MQISQEQIEISYVVSVQVHKGILRPEEGAKLLRDKHGLNINSARDFINDYRLLLLGEVFQRAMSAPAMDYYLNNIWTDLGDAYLETSLKALAKHIEYYESISSSRLLKMRIVYDKYSNILKELRQSLPLAIQFQHAVERSQIDSRANRLARLQIAPTHPMTTETTSRVYCRNPDVVAEVLERAKGICESCGAPAPFIRKSNNTPYLEVHHVIMLADKGEDTISNAIALCPNCHRKQHFG